MPAEWLLGVVLCLAGAAFTNLGLTLQKLSFLRTDALNLPLASQPNACLQPLWLLGFSIFLVGQIGGMIAMGFSSQSVVATLGSFSLVTNAVFAPLILGEQLTTPLLLSIVIIIGGSVIVILSSNHDNQDYTLPQLLGLFKRDLFVIYMAVIALCLILCVWAMVREHQKHSKQRRMLEGEAENGDLSAGEDSSHRVVVSLSFPSSPRKPLLSPSGSFSSVESEDGRASPPLSPLNPPMLSSLTPTLTAAILSSISVLLGKCTMQLIKTSVGGDNQFKSPVSYVISAVFITAAIASVHLLNTGLRRGTALFVVPFYYVSSTSLAIVGGLVYFEEFSRFSVTQMIIFFGGVGLTVLGVWISTRGQMEEEEREAEAEEEEEAKMVEAEEGEVQVKEEQKAVLATPPPRSSPASPSPSSTRPSTIPSPRSFTPRHPSIQEEPDGGTVVPVSSETEAEEEERESAKRRAWHQKRAVSEPRLSFMLPSPNKVDSSQYGTFPPPPSDGSAPPLESPPIVAMPQSRAGRTQSMSLAEPVNLALSDHHQHSSQHQRGGRIAGGGKRAYVPHYTFAFYSVLPSNPPSAKRKSRSVSAAVSRHLSPQATPTRSSPTRRLRL